MILWGRMFREWPCRRALGPFGWPAACQQADLTGSVVVGTVVSLILLAAVLAVAVWRARRVPGGVGAVPAAAIAVAGGLVPAADAWAEVRALGPTVGFLAA